MPRMKKLVTIIMLMFTGSGAMFGRVAENYPPGKDNLFQVLSLCCYAAALVALAILTLVILAGGKK